MVGAGEGLKGAAAAALSFVHKDRSETKTKTKTESKDIKKARQALTTAFSEAQQQS